MEDEHENDRGDNLNISNENPSSALKITYNPGVLRCILSKMEFSELLNARLVCTIWNKESSFFIKKRINRINFANDSHLERYLKSKDRSAFPSIQLDLRKLSTKVLAKCGLEGVQNLYLRGIPECKYRDEIDWSTIWNLKEKILSLLQPLNNINFLDLHFMTPVKFNSMEALDFLRNLENLRVLSIYLCLSTYSRPMDIGSILITSCKSLRYLKTELEDTLLGSLADLTKLLIKRKANGHTDLILSMLSEIRIYKEWDRKICEEFRQFANFGPRCETLKVCIKFEKNATQQQLNEIFNAAGKILENSVDSLKELHFFFEYKGYQSTDKFQLKVPSLPKLETVQLAVSVKGNPGAEDLEAEKFFQLPDAFPSLKQLVIATNKDMVPFHGKCLPKLEKLTYAVAFCTYKDEHLNIPYPPPTFATLRAVDCSSEVNEEFLRFVFTNLTSIQELKIVLQRRPGGSRYVSRPYLDAWYIFTGGAQPPHNVALSLNPNSDDEGGSVEDEVAENPVVEEDNVEESGHHLVASLENFTKLRELEIINATLRDIQAVAYMTQLKKVQKLDKLSFTVRIYEKAINSNMTSPQGQSPEMNKLITSDCGS